MIAHRLNLTFDLQMCTVLCQGPLCANRAVYHRLCLHDVCITQCRLQGMRCSAVIAWFNSALPSASVLAWCIFLSCYQCSLSLSLFIIVCVITLCVVQLH